MFINFDCFDMENNNKVICLKSKLRKSLEIIRKFSWLVDNHVVNFYVDEHWQKLPSGWRKQFDSIEPVLLSELLHNDGANKRHTVWPLTILALDVLLRDLCISRQPHSEGTFPNCSLSEHPKLSQVFTKGVKLKKRHEVQRMAAICKHSCLKTPVDFVVDFGAGLGHLARALGYGFGIRVCCLEMQEPLNEQASRIDLRLEAIARKHLPAAETEQFQRPTHVTLQLTTAMRSEEFLAIIEEALQLPSSDYRFGIIGLHPCGDLGATLMRMFLNCTQAVFLNFVGCCYLKLSTPETCTEDNSACGYPLSNYLRKQPQLAHLSYEAREISCHSSETYFDRLSAGDYEYLKVHSYRAAAERVLIESSAKLKNCALRSVKLTPGMEFENYFYKAIRGLTAIEDLLPIDFLCAATVDDDLSHWTRIVVFYTLRLLFAPLVESIILYDRMLFLEENDCRVEINAIFDPRISPRNHITTAVKHSSQ